MTDLRCGCYVKEVSIAGEDEDAGGERRDTLRSGKRRPISRVSALGCSRSSFPALANRSADGERRRDSTQFVETRRLFQRTDMRRTQAPGGCNSMKAHAQSSFARRSRTVALVAMLPFLLAMRREEGGSGCGGSPSDARAINFFTNAPGGLVLGVGPLGRFTRDIPITQATSADVASLVSRRIEYWGDESSALYGFPLRRTEPAVFGDVRGQRYFGWTQLLGQFAPLGSPPDRIDTAALGIPEGIQVARHYDRGLCSQFTRWSELSKQILPQFDAAVIPEIRRILESRQMPIVGTPSGVGNFVLTPKLLINPNGMTYSGANRNTRDEFIISRTYATGAIGANFLVLVLTGGFRADDAGLPTYVASDIEVRYGPDNQLTPADRPPLLALVSAQFSRILQDQVWQRVPVADQQAFQCNLQTGQTSGSSCVDLLSVLTRLPVPATHARCFRRPTDTGNSRFGRCEIRPTITRAQGYPEGFEFVLSDEVGDFSDRLLRLTPATADALCAGTRAPMQTGRRSGTVAPIFLSVGPT